MPPRPLKFTSLLFMIILNITISSRVITFAQEHEHEKQLLLEKQEELHENEQEQELLGQQEEPEQSPSLQQQSLETDNREQQETQSIYGVRWFLGDYFAFHKNEQPPTNQEMFILMFNSIEELDDEIYLMINGTRYGCYERFLEIESVGEHHEEHNKNATKEGESFTNAMYKCIVYGQGFNGMKEVGYQIISGWTIYEGKDNETVIKKYRQYVLFESILRIPQNMDTLSFFFLADWGLIMEKVEKELGYKDVMPSLKKTLKDNLNIGMMIFGGDLAYDFEGQMYIDMLKYLQPITSQIVTIATPGNHESVYHEDSLELFAESFYSPMWYKYFNYFSLTVIEKHKLVIVSYDPENYVFPWINRLGRNLTDIFDAELTGEITQYIKKSYDVVAFSHYPMHCSETGEHYQTCEQNKVRFEPFMKKFTEMGIDLYLSGHLHIYERSKPLCSETDYKFNEENIYDKQCPVFVIEGSAGNSMWVEMTKRYEPKDFSGKIVYETGYGVVTFDKRNITYEHFQVHDKENATLADKITLYEPLSKNEEESESENQEEQSSNKKEATDKIEKTEQKIVIGLEVIALVIVGGIAVCLLYQFKIKNRKHEDESKKNSHVEMIEENFETPTNNNKNMSKEEPSIE